MCFLTLQLLISFGEVVEWTLEKLEEDNRTIADA